MVIEFVGPSGSGKTTVAQHIIEQPGGPTWGRRSLVPHPGPTGLVRAFPALAFMPTIAWRLARRREARNVCRRLGRRAVLSTLFDAARNRWQSVLQGSHVNDQGLVHGLAYRTRRWPEDERLDALIAIYSAVGAAAAPSLIVHFDVAPEVAAARSKMSNPLHHDHRAVSAIVVAIQQSILGAQCALDVRTIRTDNSTTAAETAAELMTKFLETD